MKNIFKNGKNSELRRIIEESNGFDDFDDEDIYDADLNSYEAVEAYLTRNIGFYAARLNEKIEQDGKVVPMNILALEILAMNKEIIAREAESEVRNDEKYEYDDNDNYTGDGSIYGCDGMYMPSLHNF